MQLPGPTLPRPPISSRTGVHAYARAHALTRPRTCARDEVRILRLFGLMRVGGRSLEPMRRGAASAAPRDQLLAIVVQSVLDAVDGPAVGIVAGVERIGGSVERPAVGIVLAVERIVDLVAQGIVRLLRSRVSNVTLVHDVVIHS